MPITHSRRPPGRRDKRRRPEGHATLTPRKSKRAPLDDVLPVAQEADRFLRDNGRPDLADGVAIVVDHALRPGSFGNPTPNLSLSVDTAFKERVRQQASAEKVDVTAVVREELESFLRGEWEPPQPERLPRGASVDKSSLSVRIPADLVKQVDTRAEEFARERGWSLARGYKLNVGHVAVAGLARRFAVEQEKPSRGWEADCKFLLDVPEEFRTFVRDAEKAGGPDASLVLRDAFAKFLDGPWTPPRPPRAPRGQGITKVRMTIQVNEKIRDQVEQQGTDSELAGARGYRLNAQQVALAALLDAYQVPEDLLYPWAE